MIDNNMFISTGFGLVALATLFLVAIFWRARNDHEFRHDARYRLVSTALAIGKIGIFLWTLNPLMQAFGGPPLPAPVMIAASALILCAAVTLIGSTAMGGTKGTLSLFIASAVCWAVFCVWWFA